MTGTLATGGALLLLLATAALPSAAAAAQASPRTAAPPRERLSFNDGWRFHKGDPDEATTALLAYERIKPWFLATSGELDFPAVTAPRPDGDEPGALFALPDFDDRDWRALRLPHDWGIEGPFVQELPGESGKRPWWGVGWYRKRFVVGANEAGCRFYLDVDGAMSYAAVWCNGRFVGGWPYGYASFRLDLTPFINPGCDNTLAIRIDNPPDSSRWYPGGGIYRNVWLVKTAPVHVGHWGTVVTTPTVTSDAATVAVNVRVENRAEVGDADVRVQTRVYPVGKDGRPSRRAVATASPQDARVGARASRELAFTLDVARPKLWGLKRPNRYCAVTTVTRGGKLLDRDETFFGIRTALFTVNDGFHLNGKRVALQGVCNHHDLGALGAAVSTRALERQIEILQAMGCNAIRTSHNPPTPELLDLCDRMGVLVLDEFSDTWKIPKKPNGYGKLFDHWHERDLRAFIRRDRNHPCVVAWSTGNEVQEQDAPGGAAVSSELTRIAHEDDPTRSTTTGNNYTQAAYNGFQKTTDVFGFNYKPEEYGKFRDANPQIPVYGSETASCVSSRGEYVFPVENDKSGGRANFQVSSYDLYAPPWAMPPDREFAGQDRSPFSAGEFVWTGFDYLGEPTPYNDDVTNLLNFSDPAQRARMVQELKELGKIRVPSRSSYFGIIDLCGFPKDRYYLYQARWRPDFRMAHLVPHWTWPDRVGQITPVHVYTSGDEAELFVNGRSQGRRKKAQHEYRLSWDDVRYEPGEVRVVAYKNGRRWAESRVETADPAAKLTLKADRARIASDGRDLSFVTVTVADKDGRMAPHARDRVRFTLEGPGEIVATDNGDATDHEPFQASDKRAFNGLCLAIVRAKPGQHGPIRLRAVAEGLEAGEVTITTTTSETTTP